ncbi:inositol monophosphatase 2 [Pyricularia oryzae 70-15]|uniref:Inositol-1-monophosphatase n=3 Tax=Pyricularia oryzae TaxID=318829 RepID=G4N001_PYRO7|nr:inositol monophosphatase 2 [Pyricularia oryzae 70-15]EHA52239.1 inositol monophosphatase 2 [Pyricularia oryzae 70-15]KAI7914998.1 inositol monophosphatase 2 [Pyricularia oryzae]KAI7924985.1 inositol monophosphatase 2 [Pyricularia oryzae]
MMSDINLAEIQASLVAVAFEAGRMITGANMDVTKMDTKLNSVDIVTETDQAIEKMVSTKLRAAYSSFDFIGEETYVPGTTKLTDRPTFVVDPIDGTTNFIHGFPHACISLGFVVNRVPSVGVVYNPFQDEMFTAVRGEGSFLQRNASLAASGITLPDGAAAKRRLPLRTADPKTAPPLGGLSTALIAVEWGSERDGNNFDLRARVFRDLMASQKAGGRMAHSLRSLGSAALNICAVAAGQLDAYWEGGCYAWDVAAGWCILAEAGGIMASGNPGDWEPAIESRKYLAVRGATSGQKEFVEELWSVIGDGVMHYTH